MNLKDFENVIKKLNKNKFHINRTLGFNDNGEMYLESWSIFRKDMSTEEYFDPSNLVILSSKKGNTIEDIKELINKENKNSIKPKFWNSIIKKHNNGKLI